MGVLGDILGKRPLRPRGVTYQTCPRPLASAPLGQDQTQASDSKHRLFTGLWGFPQRKPHVQKEMPPKSPRTATQVSSLLPSEPCFLRSFLRKLPGLSKGETDYEGLSRRSEHRVQSRAQSPTLFPESVGLTWGAVGAEPFCLLSCWDTLHTPSNSPFKTHKSMAAHTCRAGQPSPQPTVGHFKSLTELCIMSRVPFMSLVQKGVPQCDSRATWTSWFRGHSWDRSQGPMCQPAS